MNRRDFFVTTLGASALGAGIGIALSRPTISKAGLEISPEEKRRGPYPPMTAIYISPGLDCTLRMTACWPDDLSAFPYGSRDGEPITYRRGGEIREEGPFGNIIGTTIKDIEILKFNPAYERWTKELPETRRFFYDKKTDFTEPNPSTLPDWSTLAADVQRKRLGEWNMADRIATIRDGKDDVRGYLHYISGAYCKSGHCEGIKNPTPGECLFTFLCFHEHANEASLYCGCQAYIWFDETGKMTYLKHPYYTKQCPLHVGDDLRMTRARAEWEGTSLTTEDIRLIKSPIGASDEQVKQAEWNAVAILAQRRIKK